MVEVRVDVILSLTSRSQGVLDLHPSSTAYWMWGKLLHLHELQRPYMQNQENKVHSANIS